MKPVSVALGILMLLVLVGAPLAATRVLRRPPNKDGRAAPTDNGPSLADTMNFIEKKLNQQGTVNYVGFYGATSSIKYSEEFSSTIANSQKCRIDYHGTIFRDGQKITDQAASILLKDVTKLTVMPEAEYQTSTNARGGFPERVNTSTSPAVFALLILTGNGENYFLFLDEDDANRVAKAMLHAVELCGGGNKDPF